MTAAAPTFQHPPTPPAIRGDFVPVDLPPQEGMTTRPRQVIPGGILVDALGNLLDAALTAEILEGLL